MASLPDTFFAVEASSLIVNDFGEAMASGVNWVVLGHKMPGYWDDSKQTRRQQPTLARSTEESMLNKVGILLFLKCLFNKKIVHNLTCD